MKGKHHVIIETTRLKYEFDIKRNITIIQGDSATGKTTLVDLLVAYSVDKEESGIRFQSDVRCSVVTASTDTWRTILTAYDNEILFFDEDAGYIFTKEFAGFIQETTNYYVFITRKPLYELPYSVKEIYGIRTNGRQHYPEQIFHEFYSIYPEEKSKCEKASHILTEDSGAGYQFFENVFGKGRCISAGGNANIDKCISAAGIPLFVIADGAAFGAFISRTLAAARRTKNVSICLPESFEWLILKAGIIKTENIEEILDAPEEYIDSSIYFSWERFFTKLLIKASAIVPYCQYSKENLKAYYTEGKNRNKILSQIPQLEELLQDNVTHKDAEVTQKNSGAGTA